MSSGLARIVVDLSLAFLPGGADEGPGGDEMVEPIARELTRSVEPSGDAGFRMDRELRGIRFA